MKKREWNEGQLKAINTKNCDILVSAAAGSGKTSVLTERVIRKIVDEGCNISDFLIVTFTVSAANDLREKLSKAIREAIKENHDSKLKRQLTKLPYAKIITIDSFTNSIVHEKRATLGIPAKMCIGDEAEIKSLEAEVMENVIEKCYANEIDFGENEFADLSFDLVRTAFSNNKSENQIIDKLLDIFHKYQCYPDPDGLMDTYIQKYEKTLSDIRDGKKLIDTFVGNLIKEVLCRQLDDAEIFLDEEKRLIEEFPECREKYTDNYNADETVFFILKSSLDESFESFFKSFDKIKFGNLKPVSKSERTSAHDSFGKARELLKNTVGGIKDSYGFCTENSITEQIKSQYASLIVIAKILHNFSEELTSEKFRKRIFSFDDITHYAFKLLVKEGTYNPITREFEKTEYAQTLCEKYKEVFIDEYQDVNEVQDTIFRAVSNGKNRFMVGDIKQSIYGFRGATPDIFKEYRNTFEDYRDPPAEKTAIYLSYNYRSDSSILDTVNGIFENLMNFSDKLYTENDRLNLGKPEKDRKNFTTEFTVIKKAKKQESEIEYGDDEDEYDEENAEAKYIANVIIDEVEHKGNFDYGDIGVIAKTKDTISIIKASLDARGIPTLDIGVENFFSSYEILTLTSILQAVDNPSNDIYYVSALTSPVFNITANELFKMKQENGGGDYCYTNVNALPKELQEKLVRANEKLAEWRKFSSESSPDKLIFKIFEDTHLIPSILTLEGGIARKENLMQLYTIAMNYVARGISSLSDFLRYLDDMKNGSVRNEIKKDDKTSVKLSTFHSAKGLEYPLCIVSGLSKKNKSDTTNEIVFSKKFGPAFNYASKTDGVKITSVIKGLAKEEIKIDEANETLRTLYVALTRAMNKLYIVGCPQYYGSMCKNLAVAKLSEEAKNYRIRKSGNDLEKLLIGLINTKPVSKALLENTDINDTDINMNLNVIEEEEIEEFTSSKKSELPQKAKKELPSFDLISLNDMEFDSAPYKVSVSDIKTDSKKELPIRMEKEPDFIFEKEGRYFAKKGTAMHTFMQFCDFDEYTNKGFEYERDRLLLDGFITEKQAELLDKDKLDAFFGSDIYADIKSSKNIEREKRFTILVNEKTINGKDGDEKVLVQGVSDLYFENPDGTYTLLDFKTDRVDETDGEEILTERHSSQLILYADAIEEILQSKISKIVIYSFSLGRSIEIKR